MTEAARCFAKGTLLLGLLACGGGNAASAPIERASAAPATVDVLPFDAAFDAGPLSSPDSTTGGEALEETPPTAVVPRVRADPTSKANFADALEDGTFVFPDGLRVTYRYNKECDFDTSVPCIWRHEITAKFHDVEKRLELTAKKPTGTAAGHTFRVVKEKLVVGK